jgi:DNA-binding SARP family transcriptional activator
VGNADLTDLGPAALAALLRQRRGELGITQSELARRAGVGVRTLRDLERGAVRNPRTASVRQLLAALTQPAPEACSALRIGVLGPLVVERDGRQLPLGDTREARLLGQLALSANRPLSLARAADALWTGRLPASHAELVNRYVRRLRVLCGPELRLSIVARGVYQLDVDAEQLDLLRFGRLTAQARTDHEAGDPEAAYNAYQRALDCWRGPVLACHEQTGLVADALSRQRLTATLAFADVGRLLGRHEQTIARLEAVREDEPLHEGLHARLMTALAGNGQQAAALELFEDLSTRLSTELGIEPGPELRAAQLTVLRQEVAPRTAVAGHNFLPRDLPDFVGRDTELDRLAAALLTTGGNAVHALSGMAGVGKTALAVRLGHRLAAWFPDGQLFVDLHTHNSRHAPLTAQAALHTLLRQLGIDSDRIPGRLDESAALWRSLLVGRKILVVLDDVADAAQVRPLLPGGGTDCRFVITSRSHLTSLDAVGVTPLDVLPDAMAADLFATVAGAHRVAGHDEEVREIAARCGFLPLALRIAAARLRDRPLWTVEHLLSLLRDEHRRLPALSAGDRGVGAALTSSYRRLSPAHQRLYRLLGDFPGVDIVPAAEGMARLLEDLVDMNLVSQPTLGRYRLHDLVRDHARETARARPARRRRPTVDHLCAFDRQATDACDLTSPPVLSP